jgi:Kef-type K+ transport system membrane component KefB
MKTLIKFGISFFMLSCGFAVMPEKIWGTLDNWLAGYFLGLAVMCFYYAGIKKRQR